MARLISTSTVAGSSTYLRARSPFRDERPERREITGEVLEADIGRLLAVDER